MDNLFEKTPATEPSQGEPAAPSVQGEPKPTSQGEPQGKPEPKNQEGTPQWYKSQLDKMQNEFNKKLAEKETDWGKKDGELQELRSQIERFNQEFESIKNPPPKPEQPPKQPEESFEDNPAAWFKYQNELQAHKDRLTEKRFEELSQKFSKTEAQLQKEAEIKKQQQMYELAKADMIGKFQEQGLSAQESIDCFNEYTKRESVTPENIVALYRLRKGIKPEPKPQGEKEKFPLPGAGGGAGVSQSDADGLINSIAQDKHGHIFQKQ